MFRRTVQTAKPTRFVRQFSGAEQLDLKYDFSALEPYISAQIMETHYLKHHRTYIAGYKTNSEKLAEAIHQGDLATQNNLLPLVNFNSGGTINHNLFFANLAPESQGGGAPPAADSNLGKAISTDFGSLDNLISTTNTKLAGIQGSGWAWIAKNKITNNLEVITTANQDIVPGQYVPLVGIDAWEHAYYLQYKNVKADYFKAIWNVINWEEAAKRYGA